MNDFVPGLKLNHLFYEEVVQPILAADFPRIPYSAARLGLGSEVLGYDDLTSTDHDWGLRFQLFLREEDYARFAEAISRKLSLKLPPIYRGYSTHFDTMDGEGSRRMETWSGGPVSHRIEVVTIRDFFLSYLGFDPAITPDIYDWLVLPQQKLLGVTAGRVFADGLGELISIRNKFAYYPYDVWLYLLACQWSRIGQEEAFAGRAGDTGDELGSQVLSSRLVHDIMQLCFLMERKYAPYPKWFGTAFSRLDCGPRLTPVLRRVFAAVTWQQRENPLCEAYEIIAGIHNDLGITEPLKPKVSLFRERPYRVIHGDRFVNAIKQIIVDESVRTLPTDIGSIDQFSHSTDLREARQLYKRLRVLYEE